MSLTLSPTATDDTAPDAWRTFTDADAHRDRTATELAGVLAELVTEPEDACF